MIRPKDAARAQPERSPQTATPIATPRHQPFSVLTASPPWDATPQSTPFAPIRLYRSYSTLISHSTLHLHLLPNSSLPHPAPSLSTNRTIRTIEQFFPIPLRQPQPLVTLDPVNNTTQTLSFVLTTFNRTAPLPPISLASCPSSRGQYTSNARSPDIQAQPRTIWRFRSSRDRRSAQACPP